MIKKILTLTIILLLISTSITAKTLSKIDLDITLDEKGDATIKEVYSFSLEEAETQVFLDAISQYGVIVALWNDYDTNLYLHLGNNLMQDNKTASAKLENNIGTVEFDYQIEGLAINVTEPGVNTEEWELQGENFIFPIQSGLYVINPITAIFVQLPDNAEVVQVIPQAEIGRNQVKWTGQLLTNRLVLNYEFKQVIVPTLDIQIPWPKTDPTTNLIIVILLLATTAVVGLKRKEIKKKVRHYILAHSTVRPDQYKDEDE